MAGKRPCWYDNPLGILLKTGPAKAVLFACYPASQFGKEGML
nr:hypothetical protein [uncultured Bacillus sp.]